MGYRGLNWRRREGRWLSFALVVLLLAGVIVPGSYPRTAYAEGEPEIAGYFSDMDQPQVKSVTGMAGLLTRKGKAGKFNSVTADVYGNFVSIGSLGGTLPEAVNAEAAAAKTINPAFIMKSGRDNEGNLQTLWTQGLYLPGGRGFTVGYFTLNLYDVESLAGGGYVAVGSASYSSGSGILNIPVRDFRDHEWSLRFVQSSMGFGQVAIAIKLSADGDIDQLIQLSGDTPGNTDYSSVAATADGGFTAVGSTNTEDGDFAGLGTGHRGILVKYDAAGNRQSIVEYTGAFIGEAGYYAGVPGYLFRTIAALPDGGYAIGGGSYAFSDIVSSAEPDKHVPVNSDPKDTINPFLMKVDGQGKVDWVRIQPSNELRSGSFQDVAADKTGNIVAAGYNISTMNGSAVAIMGKYAADGTLVKKRELVGNETRDSYGQITTGPDSLHSVIPLADGGYLFAGQAVSTANDYAGENVSSIGEAKGGRDYFVLKTDADLATQWISFAGGSGIEAFQYTGFNTSITDMIALSDDGFVLAGDSPSLDGDFEGLNGSPTISTRADNMGNAVLALYTYDWDGDGVINSRDFYPLNPAKSIPEGSYAERLNVDRTSVITATYSVYTNDVRGIPLVSGQEVPNISVMFDGAKLTAPVPVFDRLFKGLKHTLTFGYAKEIPGFESEVSPLLPDKRIYGSAFELSAEMDGEGVTDFGTTVKVTVPVSGIDQSYSAKLYYYNPSGPALEEVSGTDFSQEGMLTFKTSHFSRYVITGATTDQLEVDAVIAKIAALPPEVSLMQKPLVEEARAAYEALTPEQQALVTNYSKLTNLEAQLAAREELRNNLIAVNPVIGKISNLPDPVTLGDRAAVEEARAAYDALTGEQKELVDNIDKLLAAEAQVTHLQDQAAADAVIQLINALPGAVSLADKPKVTAARAAYNALTAAQKSLVTNYGKLTNAEAQISIQQSQVAALQAERNSLQSALVNAILGKPNSASAAVPVTSVKGSADVVPEMGGTVSLGSSAIVEIPAGALSGEAKVNVKIRQVDNPPAAPFTLTAVSSVYEFTAGSTAAYQFAKPVTVTLAFDSSKVPDGKQAAMYYYDDAAGKWARIGGTVNGGGISAVVYHFTKFAVFAEFPQMARTSGNAGTLKDTVNHWAKNYIDSLRQRGVIGGYPDGTFQPNRTITRAEFATLLVKALGLKGTGEAGFSDIEGHWAKEEILTAASHQIVNGYPDGKFLPDYPVTREEMVVMTVYAFQLTQKSALAFGDNAEISDWAKSGVEAAVASGIISGQPGKRFAPKATATRAEAATVLVKALELK